MTTQSLDDLKRVFFLKALDLVESATLDMSLADLERAFFATDPDGTVQIQDSTSLHSGAGVPNNANGANGDFYFRTDTPGTALQRIYVKSAGAWVALV